MEENADEVEVVATTSKKRKMPYRDEHFTSLNAGKLKCKYCDKKLSAKNSKETLQKHVETHQHSFKTRTLESMGLKRIIPSFEDAAVNFVVEGNHPFKMFEQTPFKLLIESARAHPTAELPNEITIRRRTIDKYELLAQNIKLNLEKTQHIALTTDLWTSSAGKPFMVITAHFVFRDALDACMLDFDRFDYPHSADNISARVEDVMSRFSVTDKVIAITTDNASNNVKAFSSAGFSHVRCIAHCIHLAVTEGLFLVKHELDGLRCLMIFLRNPKQSQKLEDLCKVMNITYRKPCRDVKTRWNSTLQMIECAMHLQPAIVSLLGRDRDFRNYKIPDASWVLFNDLITVLAPYKNATIRLSGIKYPTISLVVPIMDMIYRRLDEADVLADTECANVASIIRGKFDEMKLALRNDTAKIAGALDPRMKLKYFEQYEYDEVSELLQKAFEPYKATLVPSETSEDAEMFKQNVVQDELLCYLTENVSGPKQDPISYWVLNKDRFPGLSKLALKLLCIPATSVPSEQAFSRSGNLITKTRNRLAAKTVQSVMCINNWSTFLNK